MSLHEKSAQTISEEISELEKKIEINQSRMKVLTLMITEMSTTNNEYWKEIQERKNQLELRAKQRK